MEILTDFIFICVLAVAMLITFAIIEGIIEFILDCFWRQE